MQLDPTRGSEIRKTRPCVVITTDVLNARRRSVVIVPLSTSPQAAPPLLIGVRCTGTPSVAVLDQIRAVDKDRLKEKLAVLTQAELELIEGGLREVLEL